MSKRFIWQFDIDTQDPIQFQMPSFEKEHLSWEARYFWHEHETITLHGLTSDFLRLSKYHFKNTHDTYYVLPHSDQNFKKRKKKLFYKPLVEEQNGLFGYEKKFTIDNLTKLNDARRIHVKKEVLLYSFETYPAVKMEMARLEIENQIFMTFCLEGRSYNLIDNLRCHLIKDRQTCHYIQLIKNILEHE